MRNILLLFALGLTCMVARAVPADPTPAQVTQPDGTKVTVVLHGDEFFNYLTTVDGYTVVKNKAGYLTYARLDGNRLVASDLIARDAEHRSAADQAVLATLPKGLKGNEMVQQGKQMLNHRNSLLRGIGHGGHIDYSKFRGLIILVNYTDRKFADYVPSNYMPYDFYNDMVNGHDYNGFTLPQVPRLMRWAVCVITIMTTRSSSLTRTLMSWVLWMFPSPAPTLTNSIAIPSSLPPSRHSMMRWTSVSMTPMRTVLPTWCSFSLQVLVQTTVPTTGITCGPT